MGGLLRLRCRNAQGEFAHCTMIGSAPFAASSASRDSAGAARALISESVRNTLATTLFECCYFPLKIPESSFQRGPIARMRCRGKLLLDAGPRKLKAFQLSLPLLLFRGYLRKV